MIQQAVVSAGLAAGLLVIRSLFPETELITLAAAFPLLPDRRHPAGDPPRPSETAGAEERPMTEAELQMWLARARAGEWLSKEDEHRLVRLAKQGDDRAQEALLALFEKYFYAIFHRVKFYHPDAKGYADELMQAARLNFISNVLPHFRPERERRLITYLGIAARRAMLEELSVIGKVVTFPSYFIDKMEQINRASEKWKKGLMIPLSSELDAQQVSQLKAHLGSLVENDGQRKFSDAMLETFFEGVKITSIEKPLISGDPETSLAHILAAPAEQVLPPDNSLQLWLKNMLDKLSDNHREILIRRFGLYGYPETPRPVPQKAQDVSRQAAQQMEKRALEKLRELIFKSGEELSHFLSGLVLGTDMEPAFATGGPRPPGSRQASDGSGRRRVNTAS